MRLAQTHFEAAAKEDQEALDKEKADKADAALATLATGQILVIDEGLDAEAIATESQERAAAIVESCEAAGLKGEVIQALIKSGKPLEQCLRDVITTAAKLQPALEVEGVNALEGAPGKGDNYGKHLDRAKAYQVEHKGSIADALVATAPQN